MKLHIYLPDTAEFIARISEDAAMLRLCAQGKMQWQDQSLDETLCALFGVKKQQDWPWAALAKLEQQWQENVADQGYWLFASPVNLALMRDSFLLNAPVPQALSAEHEQALRHSLNQHFLEENLAFLPAPGGHWWLRLPVAPDLSTTSAYRAQGKNVADFMPQGADALSWRTRLNEVQMLLHGHPANQAREAQGLLPINSIWLHGGGVLPLDGVDVGVQVYSDDASVQGLAVLTGARPLALTDVASVIAKGKDALMVYPLEQWSANTAETLLAALRSRKLSGLTLHFAWHGRGLQLQVRPHDLWKFWRKPQAMEAYF